MNKTIARLTLAVGVGVAALLGTTPLAGATIDAKGPDCAEILGGSGSYVLGPAAGTRTVTTDLTLAAPACAEITYTLEVTYTTLTGTAARVSTTTYSAVGNAVQLAVTIPDADAPATVHGVVTTAKRAKVLDHSETDIDIDGIPGSGGGSYQG
ncbi:MAG TPA: hypothetical protein VM938_09060 [Acidimicrobiales bacterium]|nr:hypothetical protein [Acidimicrobiales bacterium]